LQSDCTEQGFVVAVGASHAAFVPWDRVRYIVTDRRGDFNGLLTGGAFQNSAFFRFRCQIDHPPTAFCYYVQRCGSEQKIAMSLSSTSNQ
ncbi:hypothetical protein, partial [Burkholderia anthina]|uniref:hypothetical protein n=1 Tax=Burkholderia anthina TaxID=179879 RepID=UPI001ABA30DA